MTSMKTSTHLKLIIAAVCLAAADTQAQDTAFTYQGLLSENGEKAQGTYQVRFTLHSAESGGSMVAGPITKTAVAVVNGLFTTTLDFGAEVFTGPDRWLEIGVRTNGGGAFVMLNPRQKLFPVPFAITAGNLTGALPASQLSGTLSSSQLSGTYSGLLTLNNAGNSFAGNGADLTNVNAVALGGYGYCSLPCYWKLTGNAGTVPGLNFVGTTDEQPLELKVNNITGFRLQPGRGGSVNLVGGYGGVVSGFFNVGATVGGGVSNRIAVAEQPSFGCTISGGGQNTISGIQSWSTISGGRTNEITDDGAGSTISGGEGNRLDANPFYCVISGGTQNSMSHAFACTISGGIENRVRFVTGAYGATLSGGGRNTITGYSAWSTISGGERNAISTERGPNDTDGYGVIGGGSGNTVFNSDYGTITGGRNNRVGMGPSAISALANFSAIGGGESNLANASYSTIPGGVQAKASNYGQMAYASGQFAATGDAQTSVYVCRGSTSDATPTELFLDGVSQRMTMPTNSTWSFDILVTGRTPDGTSAAYQLLGATRNNDGITTMAALRRQTILVEDIPTWDATMIAHATNSTFGVQVTGGAATSIRWVATVRTAEVTY